MDLAAAHRADRRDVVPREFAPHPDGRGVRAVHPAPAAPPRVRRAVLHVRRELGDVARRRALALGHAHQRALLRGHLYRALPDVDLDDHARRGGRPDDRQRRAIRLRHGVHGRIPGAAARDVEGNAREPPVVREPRRRGGHAPGRARRMVRRGRRVRGARRRAAVGAARCLSFRISAPSRRSC
ncbi:LigA [Burkholderia sp. IT-111MI5]